MPSYNLVQHPAVFPMLLLTTCIDFSVSNAGMQRKYCIFIRHTAREAPSQEKYVYFLSDILKQLGGAGQTEQNKYLPWR